MDLLNNFQIIKCLGQGGFGLVLQVKDENANKDYAIKLIPIRKDKQRDKVLGEVRNLANMTHVEGIVKYHHSWYQKFDTIESLMDFTSNLNEAVNGSIHLSECISSGSSDQGIEVTVSSVLFIKMDYFPGQNLKEWLRSLCNAEMRESDSDGTSPWVHGQILLAFHKILEIVQRIHDAGILHRDLKPENILFREPCEVCICDFGLSISVIDDGNSEEKPGIGTLAYLAPELVADPPQTHSRKSDAFALGLLLLEMLTIFGGDTEQEKFDIFRTHKEGKIHEKAERFKPETDLIRKLLCEDPEKRCSISDALRDELFHTTRFVCNVCGLKDITGIENFMKHLDGLDHQSQLQSWRRGAQVKNENCHVSQGSAVDLQLQVQLIGDEDKQRAAGDNDRAVNLLRTDVDDLKARMDRMESKLDEILALLRGPKIN